MAGLRTCCVISVRWNSGQPDDPDPVGESDCLPNAYTKVGCHTNKRCGRRKTWRACQSTGRGCDLFGSGHRDGDQGVPAPSGIRTAKTEVDLIYERLKAAQTDYETRYGESNERKNTQNRGSGALAHLRTKPRNPANTGIPGRWKKGQREFWPDNLGGMQFTTERLAVGANEHCCGCLRFAADYSAIPYPIAR